MLHLRQGLVAGYQADPFHHLLGANTHLGRFNRFEFGILAPAIVKNYSSFGDLGAFDLASPAQKNGRRWCSDSGSSSVIEFSTMSSLEDDSDVSSPPLWKTSPPATAAPKAESPSPPAPASQAIVSGHQELMEMIRNMPESAYELSLKDIVELPRIGGEKRVSVSEAFQEEKMKKTIKKRRGDENNKRNGTIDNRDFLLKMFLPAAFGPRKRSSGNGSCPRGLPKMEVEKTAETEWSKKRFSSSRDSVNSRTSRSSSTNSSRHVGGFLSGCWSLFHTNRSQK